VKQPKIIFYSFLISLFLFACQTEIEVKIPEYYNKLVVEGYIENDEYPIVMLLRSTPYFSTMNIDVLMDSVLISDAIVTVTADNGESEILQLDFVEESPLMIAYTGKTLKGALNMGYTLKIEWNNKVYTSYTKIFNTFDLDSVWFQSISARYDSSANLRIQMTDKATQTQYYQFKVKVTNSKFQDRVWINTIPAAFDNIVFRGQTFNYEIIRGSPSMLFMPEMSEEDRRDYLRMDYRLGDTVYMKYGQIDFDAYSFWLSASSEITFGQNPFMNPSPIYSNIKCNTGEKALGVWSGLAAKTVRLVFPENK